MLKKSGVAKFKSKKGKKHTIFAVKCKGKWIEYEPGVPQFFLIKADAQKALIDCKAGKG